MLSQESTTNTDEPRTNIVPTTPASDVTVNVDELKAKITEAETAVEAAGAEAMAAMQANKIREMIAAGDKAKAGLALIEKLKGQIERAEYDTRRTEREAMQAQFTDNVPEMFANLDIASVRALSFTGLVITFNEDGTVSCTPQLKTMEKAPKAASAPRPAGTGKASGGWLKDGQEYKSRELIEAFGGADGVIALDRAYNHEKYGLKMAPGFNSFVTKLAGEIGAVRVEKA